MLTCIAIVCRLQVGQCLLCGAGIDNLRFLTSADGVVRTASD